MTNIKEAYNSYYANRPAEHIYPVEFVVRTFLGTYPKLKMDSSSFVGKHILDMGYGDGRNMPLLKNLGFNISGVEISDEINKMAQKRMQKLGIEVDLKTGHNSQIPYADNQFDCVLACHSCYYIRPEDSFSDNLKEVSRVLKKDGFFIFSIPHVDTYLIKNAEPLGNGHFKLTEDPYGVRVGTKFRACASHEEIEKELTEQGFYDIKIGSCDDDFYGIRQYVWIVISKKR